MTLLLPPPSTTGSQMPVPGLAPAQPRGVASQAGILLRADSLDYRWSGVTEVLVGRSAELTPMGALVERAGVGGDALLLFGEPGTGKTALLDAAPT